MNRTDTYLDTVDLNDPNAMHYIALVRKTVRQSNRRTDQKFFVRVRGRLGKDNPKAELYRVGGPKWRRTSLDIDLQDATRADIYISPRSMISR